MKESKKLRQKTYKAALATTMAAGTLVASVPSSINVVEAQGVSFTDVKEDQHFYESVKNLTSRGIISGYEDGTFKPGEKISRAHAAKIISLALGLDTKNVKDPGFKDVSKNNPYFGHIAALVDAGIIKGYEDQTFKPNGNLTRAHIAQMLVVGFSLEEEKLSNLPFKDINNKQWFANYIQTLYKYEITTGKTATTFEPNAIVTRGQVASFINRAEAAATAKQQTVEVINISKNELTLSSGTYAVNTSLQNIFNESNLAVLKGAKVKYTVKNNEIIEVSSIEIKASGTANSNLILDGKGSKFAGYLIVNGDFVSVKNLTMSNDLIIGNAVKNSFLGDAITVIGKTIISDNAVAKNNFIASLTPVAAIAPPATIFNNSKLGTVELSKAGSIFEAKGTTSAQTINVGSNVEIKADKSITLPEVKLLAGATQVTINANVSKLNVDSKGTKLTLGTGTKVGNITLPAGTEAKDVIQDYDKAKANIENIGGKANPDAKPVTPPVTPPSNGGGNSGNDNGSNPPPVKDKFTLSLMHTNDTHAKVETAPKRITAIKDVRKQKPSAVLVDAGDVFSGTLYFNQYKGLADLAFMNLAKYDVMTFGNHEFDLGASEEGHKALADFIKGASFPFVSANADFSKDANLQGLFSDLISSKPENGKIYNGIVKEVNGEKVGFFGLTTEETKGLSSPGQVTFTDYIVEAEKSVKAFEDMGVNKIVAVSHIGYDDNPAVDNDLTLAAQVDGIDVIIGGHSHTELKKPVVVDKDESGAPKDKTIIVQASSQGDFLGTLDVEFDKNGKVIAHTGELITVGTLAEDPEAKILLEKYKPAVDLVAKEEIGVSASVALETPRTNGDNTKPSVRKNETILGNLITDGMLAKAKTINPDVIMAFQNGGGIRAGIDAGPITVGEVITVLPFGNTLSTMEITGAKLKEAFETSVGVYPLENGGFLHVAGAKVDFDSSKPKGERVVSVKYDKAGTYTEIEDTETYTVATNAFTAKGGDNYDVFKRIYEAGKVTDLGLSDWENFRDHLKTLTTIPTEVEGRIVEVKVDTPAPDEAFTLSLMHTNDTHAKVETAPKRITAIKDVRKKKPDAVLVDAGDVFSGTLYFNQYKGLADLAFMNLAKYDVMTFGNHEFDLGSSEEGHKALADFIKGASFPFVSANADFSKDENLQGLFSDLISSEPENGKIYNGIVKEVNGEKVGFFGLTTAETEGLSSPGKVTFTDYIVEAEKAVKAFEDMGVNKIVAVSHIGYDDNPAVDNDLTLAAQVDGIDVIIGGHSHTELKKPVVVDKDESGVTKDKTIIVQASSQGDFLGTLDVEFDKNGKVIAHTGELITVGTLAEDPEAITLLEEYKPAVDEVAKEEIGVSAGVVLENPRTNGDNTKPSVRKNETVLGNLITDGMLAKAKSLNPEVKMAFQNGGGIRASIDAGPITVGEVISVLPFGNTLSMVEITGAELKEAFETSVGVYPLENGGFLHVAGAKVEFDSSKAKGERVVSISYENEDGTYTKVVDTETYTIATNAFTAKGGDSYDVFKRIYEAGKVTDLGLSDWENFAEHLKTLTTIPTEVEGRIVELKVPTEPVIVEDPGTTPAPVATSVPPLYNSNPEKLGVKQIARYDSGQGETGTEILEYDATTNKGFVTNGAVGGFDILSFAGVKSGEFKQLDSTKRVVVEKYGIPGAKNITSIAAHPTEDLIAIAAYAEKTDPGYIIFATKDGKYVKHVQVGALPDMVTFTPDGKKAIVANEGEPNKNTTIDPEGSISVIDVASLTATTLNFTEDMLDENVRTSYKGASILEQLEPEYVTVSADSKTAYVSLQENNAIATVDLVNNKILHVKGLGVIDHSIEGNEMDANKDDKKANILKQPILTFHMPDAIDTFTVADKTYIITPNEGDSRDYADDGGYSEVQELGNLKLPINLDATKYANYTQPELDSFDIKTLAGYKVTTENGLNADGTAYEAIYGYGGRSFSIFDALTMKQVFDSGSQFEKIISEKTPQYFNTNSDEVKVDNRSDDKGPEPETAVVGEIDGKTYAFIALERYSGIMVYDLTNVNAPEFVTLISSRDFSKKGVTAGDVSPEGLQFIPASESPTKKALLVATHEVSGTVAVYEFGGTKIPVTPVAAEDFSGTTETPITHEGNTSVDVSSVTSLGNAVVNGDLILTGTFSGTLTLTNVTVNGDVDFTGVNGDIIIEGLEAKDGEVVL